MISPYALLRLAWRPYTYLGAILVLSCLSVPFLIAADEVIAPVQQLWWGTAPEGIRIALWHAVAFLPPAVGHVIGTYRLEVQHSVFSWHLPRLRERLAAGTAVVMLAVAAAMAALLARNEAAAAAAGGFALACYAFLLPGFVFDVAVPRAARLLMLVPFAMVLGRPSLAAEAARTHPVLVTVVLLPLAALQLVAIASVDLARLRPFRWSRYLRTAATARVGTARAAARRWSGSLAVPRFAPWLRAAAYETGMHFPLTHLGYAATAVLVARLIQGPNVVSIVACALFLNRGHLLGMRVSYPLSRIRRAQLAYLGTLLDAAAFFSLGILLLAISWRLPVPRLPLGDVLPASQPIDFLVAWGVVFALAPIAQWGRLRWPASSPPPHDASMRVAHVLRMLVFVVSTIMLGTKVEAWSDGDPQRALAALGGIAAAVQLLHAVRLYHHYTRSDLVPART